MENREETRYIVLANVNGKKTAIQVDGLFSIFPPRGFPSETPQEIQYKDERLPLYNAKDMIRFYEQEVKQKGPYEKLYRELLKKVKEVSDEIMALKQDLFSNTAETQTPQGSVSEAGGHFSSILTASEESAGKIMELTGKVQQNQDGMADILHVIKETMEEFRKHQGQLLENIHALENIRSQSNTDLSSITASLSSQDGTTRKLKQISRMQEDLESRLISILFNFGIKLRREENPDDEVIKRGEKMLDLLQGDKNETINQKEVDQLLSEFLK